MMVSNRGFIFRCYVSFREGSKWIVTRVITYNLYFRGWKMSPNPRVINRHITSYIQYPEPLSTTPKNWHSNGKTSMARVWKGTIKNGHFIFQLSILGDFVSFQGSNTVDGSEILLPSWGNGSLSHCLRSFTDKRWCRISSINSSNGKTTTNEDVSRMKHCNFPLLC